MTCVRIAQRGDPKATNQWLDDRIGLPLLNATPNSVQQHTHSQRKSTSHVAGLCSTATQHLFFGSRWTPSLGRYRPRHGWFSRVGHGGWGSAGILERPKERLCGGFEKSDFKRVWAKCTTWTEPSDATDRTLIKRPTKWRDHGALGLARQLYMCYIRSRKLAVDT